MQNFSILVQGAHFKFRVEWMGGRKKCVCFQQKTGYISETVKDTTNVTINH